MPYDQFSQQELLLLGMSLGMLLTAVILFPKRTSGALIFLFLGALGLGFFIASLDDFLVLWDEQYHAVVAKHMVEHPFKPMLYTDPMLKYNPFDWTGNHIWLHKQPLFLWLMALSIKFFGTNVLAVRLPSIILHAFLPLLVYRMGKTLVNPKTGFYGALLMAMAHFPLELAAGLYPTDHNDVAFLFFITASFWAWFEYQHSKQRKWLILIGLFAGAAVLVKWLMGLLVFVLWTLVTLLRKRLALRWNDIQPVLYSGLISVAVFLPWQLYIHWRFPQEAKYELQLNGKHFFEAVEGHAESTWFYFTKGLGLVYGSGDMIPFILLAGLIWLIIDLKDNRMRVFVASAVTLVYLFYTLAATKMVSFPLIVAPFIILGLAHLILRIVTLIQRWVNSPSFSHALEVAMISLVGFAVLDLSRIERNHSYAQDHTLHNHPTEQKEMEFIRSLDQRLPNGPYVIFNAEISFNGHIPIMFFTDHIAYRLMPTPQQVDSLLEAGQKVAVLNIGNIPNYITLNEKVELVEVQK